jgi:hypothetical protein
MFFLPHAWAVSHLEKYAAKSSDNDMPSPRAHAEQRSAGRMHGRSLNGLHGCRMSYACV